MTNQLYKNELTEKSSRGGRVIEMSQASPKLNNLLVGLVKANNMEGRSFNTYMSKDGDELTFYFYLEVQKKGLKYTLNRNDIDDLLTKVNDYNSTEKLPGYTGQVSLPSYLTFEYHEISDIALYEYGKEYRTVVLKA